MHVFVVSGVCLRGTAGCRRRSAAGYNSITYTSPYSAKKAVTIVVRLLMSHAHYETMSHLAPPRTISRILHAVDM